MSSTTSSHDPYGVWRSREYRLFSAGWVAFIMAGQIETIAIGLHLYAKTENVMALGWIGLVRMLPFILLAIAGGQLADRFDRRKVLLLTQSGGVLAVSGLLAAAWSGASVGWFYVFLGLSAVTQALGSPARSALLPQLVSRSLFSNAMAWNSSLFQLGTMLGPALGGLLMGQHEITTRALGLALAFRLVSLVAVAMLKKREDFTTRFAGERGDPFDKLRAGTEKTGEGNVARISSGEYPSQNSRNDLQGGIPEEGLVGVSTPGIVWRFRNWTFSFPPQESWRLFWSRVLRERNKRHILFSVSPLSPAKRVVKSSSSTPASGKGNSWRDLLAGVRFVGSNKIILATITLDLIAVLVGGVTYLLPLFARDVLHVGGLGLGLLRSAEAVGAIATAMVVAHLPPIKRAGRAMLWAVAGFGAATVMFGLSQWFWVSLVAMVLVGATDNISVIVRHTLVQVLTPDSMRGRVSAVNNVFITASNDLGGFESGASARAFDWGVVGLGWAEPGLSSRVAGAVGSVLFGGVGAVLAVVGCARKWPGLLELGSLKDIKPADEAVAREQAAEEESVR